MKANALLVKFYSGEGMEQALLENATSSKFTRSVKILEACKANMKLLQPVQKSPAKEDAKYESAGSIQTKTAA